VVQGPDDDVLIDVPGNMTVTHRSGSTQIKSLLSNSAFTLSGGTLSIAQTVRVNNTLMLNGGTLKGATVLPGAGGLAAVIFNSGPTILDGVRIDADMSGQNSAGTLTVINGLVLNGTVTLTQGNYLFGTGLNFSGSQTLSASPAAGPVPAPIGAGSPTAGTIETITSVAKGSLTKRPVSALLLPARPIFSTTPLRRRKSLESIFQSPPATSAASEKNIRQLLNFYCQ